MVVRRKANTLTLVPQPAMVPVKRKVVRKPNLLTPEQKAVQAISQVGTGYPYGSMAEWFWSKRAAYVLRGNLTPDVVREISAAYAQKAADNQLVAMVTLQKALDLGEWAKNALEAGAIVAGIGGAVGAAVGLGAAGIGAAAGAAAGSALPVIGTLIGACVGFIIGVCTTLIPVEKWDVMNKFHDLTGKMAPVERYFLWNAARKAMDNVRALEKRGPLPPWWLKTPEFYTIYGGLDSVQVFMYEDLSRQEAFIFHEPFPVNTPMDLSTWPITAVYGLGAVASHAAATEKLRDSLFFRDTVNDGKGTRGMQPYLKAFADVPVQTVRELVIQQGLPDFSPIPITDDVVIAAHDREKQLAFQGGM